VSICSCIGGAVLTWNSYFTIPVLVSQTLAHTNLTAFLNLLNQVNLTSIVDNLHRITIFVPTNSALAAASVPTSTPTDIQNLIYSHIVSNFSGYLPDLFNGLTLTTLANTTLTVTVADGEYYVNGAHIIDPDVLTDNGVINIIDKVSDSDSGAFQLLILRQVFTSPTLYTGGADSSRKPPASIIFGIIALAYYYFH
jgi:hypothetical protein